MHAKECLCMHMRVSLSAICLTQGLMYGLEAQAGLELILGKNDFGLLIFLLLLPSSGITA